ncbi:MAG: SDR family NAD(P)-dependent oxidoreductase, partial [Gemmatimonadota bacterium]|nr:SDR family NAD(P)-dependent oxidoreductase [Gemmatimonadota bacterium]
MRLEQKVCFVTGAGSGMGRVAAETFAREGARVAVVD